VDVIEGLSPSIAIRTKTTSRSLAPRSAPSQRFTIIFRVVYASVGVPTAPIAASPSRASRAKPSFRPFCRASLPSLTTASCPAPIVRGRKGAYRKELEKLGQDGYVRVRINGELYPMDDLPALDKRKNHTIEVVVDRLLVKQGIASRLEQSLPQRSNSPAASSLSPSSAARNTSSRRKLACPIAASACPFSSRALSVLIRPMARAPPAMASASNTISIQPRFFMIGAARSLMAASAPAPRPPF